MAILQFNSKFFKIVAPTSKTHTEIIPITPEFDFNIPLQKETEILPKKKFVIHDHKQDYEKLIKKAILLRKKENSHIYSCYTHIRFNYYWPGSILLCEHPE